MNNVERFRRVLRFEPVDRLPCIEWAPWWDQTIARWKGEGLPPAMPEGREGMVPTQEFFGLDPHYQVRIPMTGSAYPRQAYGEGPVSDMASYEAVRPHLYPDIDWDTMVPAWVRERHAAGELAVWFTLDGFFWFPRVLFGIERHFYAFHDYPEVMKQINADVVVYARKVLAEITQIITPEFMTFAEDMSYNHGPMLSRRAFREYLAPYYEEIIPEIKAKGILPVVDSDGNIETCVEWFTDVGVEGMLPFERQSGVDLRRIRDRAPRLSLIGGFDKMTMDKDFGEMRAEWDRLLPVMRDGGFIPSCDHQTPPGVSINQYRDYLALMREYCARACI